MITTQTTPAVVPDFGDEAGDRKICFICSKGNLDMAYPGLIMAYGALGEGVAVDLFFTFWGMDMINKGTWGDLQFSMLGNTAMHMKGSTKHLPQGLGGLPGMTAFATNMLKKQIADLGVPEVPDFIELLHEMGARFWACKLSVDMMGLTKEDMFEGVEDIINVGEFIELSNGSQIIFI